MLSIVIAGLSGVDTSILYLSCNKGESQNVFGVYNSLGEIGLLFASLVFSAFVGDNYTVAAFLTVISYGLAAILSLFLEEVKIDEKHVILLPEIKEIFAQIMKNKRLIIFLVSVAFMSETHQTITVFLNQIQYEKCGLSASSIGYIYIAAALVGLLGVFSGKITQKLGIKYTGVALYFITILSCVVLGVTNRALFSVLGVLFLNVINSFFEPYQMELQNRQVLSKNRATELSVYAMIIDTVSAGTSVLFGALANVILEAAFLFGAGLCFVGLVLLIVWHRHMLLENSFPQVIV